jgi:hypothetical protein
VSELVDRSGKRLTSRREQHRASNLTKPRDAKDAAKAGEEHSVPLASFCAPNDLPLRAAAALLRPYRKNGLRARGVRRCRLETSASGLMQGRAAK